MQQKHDEKSLTDHRICYWDGILDPQNLASTYQETLINLAEGNYSKLDLEKLRGHDVYSVRINKADRLLFTTIMVQGKPYLMLLDVVLNHDYFKSRFLKKAVLKHYLELNGQAISEHLVGAHFETCTKKSSFLPENKTPQQAIQFTRIDFYNQKFIALDDAQLGVVTQKSLPLILSGAPGSGKSCIALSILGQWVASGKDYPILYVTELKTLANSMKQAWDSLPLAQGLTEGAVQFKSYEELITSLCHKSTFVQKNHCLNWLGDYVLKNKQVNKMRKQNVFKETFFKDLESMHQEFRIICGCNNLQAYLNMGKKQSLFHQEDEKKWLFTACKSYQKRLAEDNHVYAPFYPLDKKNQFELIVVDEAQDFSHMQLRSLADLAFNKQICYCEDNRQNLADTKSKTPLLLELMNHRGKKEAHIMLSHSYRLPAAIMRIANAVSRLKSIVTGHGQAEIEIPALQGQEGYVEWINKPSSDQLSDLQQKALSPDLAIVTLEQYKKEARILFGNALLVFTPKEIKGLEYKTIVAYRLFNAPLFKDANKILEQQAIPQAKTLNNRAKQGQEEREHFGPLFNAVFSAFTRATHSLYIIQEQSHDLLGLCQWLLKAVRNEQQAPPDPIQNDLEDLWFREVKTQINKGNMQIAKDIYLNKLNKNSDEFEAFKAHFIEPVCALSSPVTQPKRDLELEPKPRVHAPKSRFNPPKSIINTPKAPSTPMKKAVVSNDTKQVIPGEIIKLLKSGLTSSALSVFFEHTDAQRHLCAIRVGHSECLLAHLLSETNLSEILVLFFAQNPSHLSAISDDTLCRLFSIPPVSAAKVSPFLILFMNAARQGHSEIIEVLAQRTKHKINLDTLALDGHTPAYIAAENGHFGVILALGELNVNLNKPNESGFTPAYIAAQNGYAEVILALGKLNVKLDEPTENGFTIAHIAAQEGHAAVILVLGELEVNLLDKPDKRGDRPAHIAAYYGHVELILNLRICNASLNSLNKYGFTPAHIAAQNGYAEVILALGKCGANLNSAGTDGRTPAYIAAENGHAVVILALGECGANLNSPGTHGRTPAYIAAENGHAAVISALGELKVSLDEPDQDGFTPAHVAAYHGNFSVIVKLMELKTNVDLPFKLLTETLKNNVKLKGERSLNQTKQFIINQQKNSKVELISLTPYDIAAIMGHEMIIQLLQASRDNKLKVMPLGFFSPSQQPQGRISVIDINVISDSGRVDPPKF